MIKLLEGNHRKINLCVVDECYSGNSVVYLWSHPMCRHVCPVGSMLGWDKVVNTLFVHYPTFLQFHTNLVQAIYPISMCGGGAAPIICCCSL